MKLKDIKTLITSGTILMAVALYMIFGNPPPEKDEVAEDVKQNESVQESGAEEAPVAIPLEEAEKVTENEAVAVDYLSANDGDTLLSLIHI